MAFPLLTNDSDFMRDLATDDGHFANSQATARSGSSCERARSQRDRYCRLRDDFLLIRRPDHPVEHLLDRHSGPGATGWISARPDTIEHVVVEFDQSQT